MKKIEKKLNSKKFLIDKKKKKKNSYSNKL